MMMRGLWRRFAAETSANAAMIFGLSLAPILFLAGGAIDYERAVTVKSELRKAADTAALAAAREAARMIGAGETGWSPKSAKLGVNVFSSNARTIAGSAATATPTVTVTKVGQAVIARVAFVSNVPTQFLKLIAMSNINVGQAVEASAMLPQYANVSLVLDVSPSMAIAATAADMANLKSLTLAQIGSECAFACHDVDGAAALSNYQIARSGNITLRIDVVKSAAQSLVSYMSMAAAVSGQFTMGLYTLSSSLRTLATPTSNFSALLTAINAVDFDRMSVVAPTLPSPTPQHIASGVSVSHYADTDFAASFTTLNTAVPNDGSGVSALSRQQVAFIVTDGLSDVGALFNPSVNTTYVYPPAPNFASGNDWGKVTAPIEASLCDSLKQRGVKVGVLYVPYVADPADVLYQKGVMTNAPPAAVEANLRACASAGLFYEASDQTGIAAGLRALFNTAALQTAARLTQ